MDEQSGGQNENRRAAAAGGEAAADRFPTQTPGPASSNPIAWLAEGGRTALLLAPRWPRLHAPPSAVMALIALAILLPIALQRLWVAGAADFNWRPILAGWAATGLAAWVCFALRHRAARGPDGGAPDVAQLFSLLLAQGVFLSGVYGIVWAVAVQIHSGPPAWSATTSWALWGGFWLWLALAQLRLLVRSSTQRVRALALAAVLLFVGYAESGLRDETFWIAAADGSEADVQYLRLTQEVMETQPKVFEQGIRALRAQRPDIVDVYVLTFSPFAHEAVFRRESQTVAEVMAQRFDAEGRTLQLLNHAETAAEWPWATPLNLQRAIQRLAAVMDRDEDILFLHLTSHGAKDGELAAQFWPLSIEAVTPQLLRRWLDEAGIRYRVVSVSACYSGSWIEPLKGEGTLVMTAADADNTSYGCGRKSELTYFGRAMFDEQLRRETRSFEAAHAAAATLIAEREREAGKDDGYSNPQIAVGDRIRLQLDSVRRRLEGETG
jgi:hypothetical protein